MSLQAIPGLLLATIASFAMVLNPLVAHASREGGTANEVKKVLAPEETKDMDPEAFIQELKAMDPETLRGTLDAYRTYLYNLEKALAEAKFDIIFSGAYMTVALKSGSLLVISGTVGGIVSVPFAKSQIKLIKKIGRFVLGASAVASTVGIIVPLMALSGAGSSYLLSSYEVSQLSKSIKQVRALTYALEEQILSN